MGVVERNGRVTAASLHIRVLLIAGIGLVGAAILFSRPPIRQDLAYHQFADQRAFLGIPHFLNVVSNIPLVLFGGLGLWFLLGGRDTRGGVAFEDPGRERRAYVLLFLGIGLTGFGSAYYHLEPNNERLVWDRLPITVAVMAMLAAVMGERIHRRLGEWLLLPLVLAGLGSVMYWHFWDDLRPYALAQFYPMAAILLMVLLLPSRYTRGRVLLIALGWYVLARISEHPGDAPIYAAGEVVSGHTLKHVFMAVGAYWVLRMLKERQPIGASEEGLLSK